MKPSEKKNEQTIDGMTSCLILISKVQMSGSAEAASGSSVACRGLTSMLDDENFGCCAALELDGNQYLFNEKGKLRRPACGVQGGTRLLNEATDCFLLCTCNRGERFELSRQHKVKKVKRKEKDVDVEKQRELVSEYYVYSM